MTIKINKNNRLTKALLETAKDIKDAGVFGEAAYEKITMRHLSYDHKGPGGFMKNEKVEDKLFNVTVFFIKASTKLTLAETIRKAQRLISQIEAEIKPGQREENRTLKQHKKHVANLIKVQKQSIEVFDTQERAEGWLKSPILTLGWDTPMELMISDKGIEMVLNELGRIEHGVVS